jgi:signal transduction histidine kinase
MVLRAELFPNPVQRSETAFATIVVRDDGIGGAAPVDGSGLVGLVDRVEALGSRLHIESPPGRGTQLTAEDSVLGEASSGNP